jgi:NADPH-dependent 7-cyano-7-deazaguanine reductase QueF-like protein
MQQTLVSVSEYLLLRQFSNALLKSRLPRKTRIITLSSSPFSGADRCKIHELQWKRRPNGRHIVTSSHRHIVTSSHHIFLTSPVYL